MIERIQSTKASRVFLNTICFYAVEKLSREILILRLQVALQLVIINQFPKNNNQTSDKKLNETNKTVDEKNIETPPLVELLPKMVDKNLYVGVALIF